MGRCEVSPKRREGLQKEEAAKRLGVSARSLDRLIAEDVLRTERALVKGRWRTFVRASDVEREAEQRERQKRTENFDRDYAIGFTLRSGSGSDPSGVFRGGLPDYYTFLPPGDPTDSIQLPKFELSVGLEDLYRYAFQRFKRPEDFEAARLELRDRLAGRPEAFAVRFTLDSEKAYSYLSGIVRRRFEDSDLPREVASRLMMRALHNLCRIRSPEHLERYVMRSAINLLRDRWRADKRYYTGALDLDRLSAKPEEDDGTDEDGHGFT